MIEFPSNGENASGYFANPAGGSGPGVVVIQEWWGLVPQLKRVADRLAAEGFSALAVDLYHGEIAGLDEPDEAGKKAMSLRLDQARREMTGAVRWLRQSPQVSGDAVGVVGFCMGGGLAYLLAGDSRDVAVCVSYYGVIPWREASVDFRGSRAAFLGHYGDRDESNPRDRVEQLEREIREAGRPVEFHWYPGAGHAFFNEDRPEVYDPRAAERSWDRTLAFFRQHISA